MTAIRGNASLAALDIGSTHPAAVSIADIERAAERASELVQRILAFSRPRPPATEHVNLATLVQEVVGLLRPTLPAGVELKLSLPPLVPSVAVDPGQLHQVLMNLCTNAWQALAGKPGRVEIVVQERTLQGDEPGLDLPAGGYVWLAVVDSGEGMSRATQERIFEPFFTTKAPGQGTGLGLSVAHGIVQNHGGALRVKSSPGQGSTFSIYLPVGARGEPPAHGLEPDSSRRVARGPKRVAYVDDEPAVLSVMVRQLERHGYPVRGFASAPEFLASLRETPDAFDVVVTDYNMPEVSGLELIREAQKLTSRLAFVLSSGYLSDDLCDAAARLGVVCLVMKPEALERVCQAIDAAVAPAPAT